ncbi:MAG TPA: acetyl-CoA acetyltransferase [Candidatus Dormibacteraeota bacterium]|jgi:acetyl-CoA acetyltransferase|nr:acetyl-CoA acetyltransferase [Candidatus Dormibacteraeota bacterium]
MTAPRAAITGVGYTDFSRRSGRSVLDLAAEACGNAIEDAGLDRADVDGVASFMVMHDSVPCQAVATALALGDQRLLLDVDLGGQGPCYLVTLAAAAVTSGIARNVVVFRAMNGRSGNRVGTMQFAGMGAQYRYPIGYDAYLMYVAMWGQRFLHETGGGAEDLGAVAIAQRRYAEGNPRAARREPLDMDAYMAMPYVVDPFRAADCTIEVDGACAVVVSSVEQARSLRHPPAVVAAGAYRAGPRSGLDIGDHLLWQDYTRNYTSLLADDLYRTAGVGPRDVQLAQIYDCFSSTVLIGLEGLGLAGRGEAGGFVRSGATAIDGALPVNTNGGLLSEGYLHGMNTVTEAVLQVQGRGGDRQAPRHDVCAVTSGALMDGSALILTADR